MTRKLCLVLAIVLLIGVFPLGAAAESTASEWALPYVGRAAELGLIPIRTAGRYQQAVTRSEFCSFAVLLYEKVKGETIGSLEHFSDTDDIDVAKMGGLGIVRGIGDGLFAPNAGITREEAAAFLCRLAGALDRPLRESWPTFTDNWAISDWARGDAGRMQAASIMSGEGAGVFNPRGGFTIEQTVKTMLVVFDLCAEPAPVPVPIGDISVAGKQIPILMYHAIADVPTTSLDSLFVRPSELEAQLAYLKENGFQAITFEDLDNIGAYSKPVLITFDDGYKDNYTILFPLLKKYNMKATIFVITNSLWGADFMTSDNLIEMSQSGLVSIQSHTVNHNLLTGLGQAALHNELKQSKEYIESLLGRPVVALCYPVGAVNETVRAAASQYYKYAVLNYGGKFVCGGNLLMMQRVRINRGTGLGLFASLVG